MNRKHILFALLSCAVMLETGCQAPQASLLNNAAGRPMTSARMPTIQSAKQPTAPSPQTQSALQPPQTPPIRQVAYNGPMQQQPAGVSQAGFFNRRRCATDNCSSGQCMSCQPADAPQESCGYIHTTPYGWNAYGIDPQEFICDGGDKDPRARLLKNDSIDGLQGEDTVVHYTTDAGDIEFQASNRACVYSPRYASVRRISQAVEGDRTISLANVERPIGSIGIAMDEGGHSIIDSSALGRAEVTKRIDAIRDRERGTPIENVLQTNTQGRVMAVLSYLDQDQVNELQRDQIALLRQANLAAIRWTVSNGVEVAAEFLKAPMITRHQKLEGFTVYDFPDAGRLRIAKLADRAEGKPGETVTFTIRVDNVGDSTVNQVVLTDNLTTRLEYIKDSQESTADADFVVVENAEDSLMLQWKLKDGLKVGESATVTFECRLR